MTIESDETLVDEAKTDKAEFGKLYERYLSRIYSYIYYRTNDSLEAEDLTAKVFLQALTNIDRYSHRGVPFSAWLFRIAHNLVANWYRDRSRRSFVGLDALETAKAPGNPIALAEDRVEMRKAIAKLSLERQNLILLKYGSDLTNAEIAAVFGKSEGAVKALLHRTLRSLRSTLQSGKVYEDELASWPEVDQANRRGRRRSPALR